MKAAFFYAPDPPPVRNVFYGRGAANRALWRALALYGSGEHLHCLTPDRAAALELRAQLDRDGADHRQLVRVGSLNDLPALGLGTIFRNDPNIAGTAWTRRTQGGADTGFSLCGLTHTLTPLEVMRWISDCMIAPIHDWDALVCTSQAARRLVETLFEIWSEHLSARLGDMGWGNNSVLQPPQRKAPLRLPIIPLGVDPQRFARGPQWEAWRDGWRRRLGVGADDAVVLFLGRLSYYEKAHPFALHEAVARAAAGRGTAIHLVQAGRFPDPSHEALYRTNADRFCGRAQVHFVDGGDPDFDGLWAAGDIFVSLSDNLQETFGLTPVEAMAAGLPVVVSDWDGYRDTVEHGVTGFRIPTVTPPAGDGDAIGNLFLNSGDYPRHIGMVSQRTAVDLDAAAAAIARLADDAALRNTMGAAGRCRVATHYDWRAVVPQYEALWDELDARRRRAQIQGGFRPAATPLSPDPFRLYAGFPTYQATDDCAVSAAPGWRDRVTAVCDDSLNRLHAPSGPVVEMLEAVEAAGKTRLGTLLTSDFASQHADARSLLVWLMKVGLLRIETAG